jgi:hypothetical protein
MPLTVQEYLTRVMSQEPDIIQLLKTHLANYVQCDGGDSPVMPVASHAEIDAVELMLGFELPPTLKRIYLEIGNGGYLLGPGYGLLGLPGGYDNHDGWNIVKTTSEVSHGLEWWDRSIVICDWGCSKMSCIDCSDTDFTVYRWDGNFWDDVTDSEDPSDELWSIESDTFDEWVLTPNSNMRET